MGVKWADSADVKVQTPPETCLDSATTTDSDVPSSSSGRPPGKGSRGKSMKLLRIHYGVMKLQQSRITDHFKDRTVIVPPKKKITTQTTLTYNGDGPNDIGGDINIEESAPATSERSYDIDDGTTATPPGREGRRVRARQTKKETAPTTTAPKPKRTREAIQPVPITPSQTIGGTAYVNQTLHGNRPLCKSVPWKF
ncbi:hypothetical protein PRIPAC_72409 [Pristionchus pacificus]|uniref:Uncharacterized protein n=1 Tax=Pristionchus pacificus TaxID=54126 RepID=A0A454XT40_PRIPA|nr:hypothetical protein PRIPAC_72409 [Pristionchus pacificus]|eukprot:PDM74255.1 hypothetical protein PRIPAC_41611 [Pristionchus pacificus]